MPAAQLAIFGATTVFNPTGVIRRPRAFTSGARACPERAERVEWGSGVRLNRIGCRSAREIPRSAEKRRVSG